MKTATSQAVPRAVASIMEACDLVGVHRRTIYNWIAAGKVEFVRTAGGSVRIYVDTLWRQSDGRKFPRTTTIQLQTQGECNSVEGSYDGRQPIVAPTR